MSKFAFEFTTKLYIGHILTLRPGSQFERFFGSFGRKRTGGVCDQPEEFGCRIQFLRPSLPA